MNSLEQTLITCDRHDLGTLHIQLGDAPGNTGFVPRNDPGEDFVDMPPTQHRVRRLTGVSWQDRLFDA
jgi:hypothetical protein